MPSGGGDLLAHARAPVLPAARARRPGARRGRASLGAVGTAGSLAGRRPRVGAPLSSLRDRTSGLGGDTTSVADGNRMVFLGFGKYARADKIYAVEPIRDERRGHGRRTLVWVEGVSEPIIASRTERTILHEMGEQTATGTPLLDQI